LVKGISLSMEEDKLLEKFSQFGKIIDSLFI
jgi:hypothetical protein